MASSFTINTKNKMRGDELKRRLIDTIQSEKTNFLDFANLFYKNDHRKKEDYIQFCQEIVATIDRILKEDNWDDSLFLRNAIKPLRDIQQQAMDILAQAAPEQESDALHAMPTLNKDMTLVYISVFQSDGFNLKRWELQLRSISDYLVGRPVYENEEDVKKVIRLRLTKTSEAYVVAAVKQSMMINDAHQPRRVDRHGSTLITLKPGAVSADNILKFVHQDKTYRFVNGNLIHINSEVHH